MSIPSLSRPSLAGWPSLPPTISSELARSRFGPMLSSHEATLSPTAGDARAADADSTAHPSVIPDGMEVDEDMQRVASSSVAQERTVDVEMTLGYEHVVKDEDSDVEGDDEDGESVDTEDIKDFEVLQNGGPFNPGVIQELIDDNARLTRSVASQHATIDELRKQLQEAVIQLAATEKRLITVSQDLDASRSFVAKEDADGQQILVVFRDVNEGVDDLTFLLLDAVADPPEGAALDLSIARALLQGHELIRKEFGPFIYASLFQGMSLLEFSAFFIPALLNAVLLQTVFRPFAPGLGAERSAHLEACYEDICRREPQDRAARWRSITYARANPSRDDESLVPAAVDLFYSALEASLPHIVPSDSEVISSLRKQFAGAASKVVRDALKLQDLAMSTYISFDYHIIAPPANSSINPVHTKTAELLKRCPHSLPLTRPGEGQVSLAVVSFGLSATKGTQRNHSGNVERVVTVVEKASVVAAACPWASSHAL